MVDAALRKTPLGDEAFAMAGLQLEALEPRERISLRAEESAVTALGRALGVPLPRQPLQSQVKGDVAALWIGPDEWLVTAPLATGLSLKTSKVKAGLFSNVDISHRNAGIIVSGSKAVDTLNSGCPRDLSLEVFPVGACARTLFGKAEIILWRQGKERFHVECWRSFADYVWKYLMAGAEGI